MGKFNAQLKIFVVLLTCTTFLGWIDPASDNNGEGLQLYNEEKYDEAISKFSDAQSFMQESDSLNFNIANSHYKEGKLPEAEKAFKNIIKTENNILKAKANYNLGNTMYKQNKFKESLDYYKKAIELSEEEDGLTDEDVASLSEDAKYNFEFVRKKMEEMQQDQQEQQDQEKQDQEEQEEQQDQEKQDQQEDQEKQEQDKQQDQQEEQHEEEQKDKDEQEKNPTQENETKGPPPPQPHEKKEMTKEEAERLLDTLNQAEMAARHSQEKEKPAHYYIEKDW